MSAHDRSGSFNLEHLKKEAKRLLRGCRAGELGALRAVQRVLPGLRALDPLQAKKVIKLADVHHALAIQRGFGSWADLTRHTDPLSRLLAGVRGGHVHVLLRDLPDFARLASISLYAAAALGDSVAVARHLESGANGKPQVDKWTPFMYACASPLARVSARHATSLAACAELLLDAGADPNATAADGDQTAATEIPAIMRAMMAGNMPLVVRLRKRGVAEPLDAIQRWAAERVGADAVDLHRFFGEYFRRPEVRERMIAAQAEFRARQGTEQTWPADPREYQQLRMPNMLAARADLWAAMLDRGFDPAAWGVGGRSALHGVATYAPVEFVEAYLSRGGNPNIRDDQGRSVIATAVRAGNLEVADLLRRHGVVDDATPLDRLLGACLALDEPLARQLVADRPDLPAALSRDDVDTLVRAAGRGNIDQVKLMLDVGIRPDQRNETGAAPIHQAAWRGQIEVVRLLVERGASVTLRDDLYGQTPRDWALHGSQHADGARERCLEIATYLGNRE